MKKKKDIVNIENLQFKDNNLITVIVQDCITQKILMTAYANKEAIMKTLETGYAHFWSRSRGKLWLKGETSGNRLKVFKVMVDCDSDGLIYLAEPLGPICHTGNMSCFFRELQNSNTLKDNYRAEIVSEITSCFEKAQLIKKRWIKDNSRKIYEFILDPITAHITPQSPRTIAWIASMLNEITSNDIDKVVVPESSSCTIGTLVAQMKGKPMAIVRKKPFYSKSDLLDEVGYSTGYEKGTYYIYDIYEGERILLIDDIISTGGTLVALIETLQRHNVKIVDVACVIEKEAYSGRQDIEKRFGIKVKTLIKIAIEGKKIRCKVEK